MPKPSVIVHGPRGCGKTRNASALCQHFGLTRVVEIEEVPRFNVYRAFDPEAGALYLTPDEPPAGWQAGQALSFAEAMQRAGRRA